MSREFRIKWGEKYLTTIKSFSATEKVIFGILTLIALLSTVALVLKVNNSFLVSIPSHGGRFVEGVVGLPRSVNPVLAFTDVDSDLSSLIFSGLMKYKDGKLIPDLAKSYTISPDGLLYTFTLKDGLRFQDGVPLTADDVEFTIQKINDSVIKSSRRADWANISAKAISPSVITFTLKQPYAPFLSNTTLGIIPKHIWNKVSSDQFIFSKYNIEPVGAGPYQVKSVARDNGGIPVSYTLSPFSRHEAGEPFIKEFTIYFYPNEKAVVDAYNNGTIKAMARISASEASRLASSTPSARILHTPLPRIFGIFFNQNQAPIFTQDEVRQALNMATDKGEIVNKVLSGYGVASDSPLPSLSTNGKTFLPDIEGAKALLIKNGWIPASDGTMTKKDKKGLVQNLEFSIATADSPDLKLAADLIKSQWKKIGAHVTIKVFEYGDLYQNIITTRKYDALLFGESIGKDLDLYAFWHSSQRNSPGLNVAMYVNSKVDKILETVRTTSDESVKKDLYSQFETAIQSDIPAIFLYSPEFIYVVPKELQGLDLENISYSTDRFYGVNTWYVATDSVWEIFKKNNTIINNK